MRPIDADALRDKLQEECSECGNCSYLYPDGNCHIGVMLDILEEDAPTIDAEPVRHGKWVHGHFDNSPEWECSNCVMAGSDLYRFCPHCGARMDGGESNAPD